MATTVLIPTPEDGYPDTTLRVSPDGEREYLFRFLWSPRAERWTLNISTPEGDPIVSGIRIVEGYNLLSPFVVEGLDSEHRLFAVDMLRRGKDPDQQELGNSTLLVWQFP